MNFILDTHIFLWALFEPEKISKKVRASIREEESKNYISAITFWEISLKFNLGKLKLNGIAPDILPQTALDDGFSIVFKL